MCRMEFDNLIDSSRFFFLFEEEQQLRAIENKRGKERKNSVEYVKFNDGAPPHLISFSQSFNFFLLSINFDTWQRTKRIGEEEEEEESRGSLCAHVNNFTCGQKSNSRAPRQENYWFKQRSRARERRWRETTNPRAHILADQDQLTGHSRKDTTLLCRIMFAMLKQCFTVSSCKDFKTGINQRINELAFFIIFPLFPRFFTVTDNRSDVIVVAHSRHIKMNYSSDSSFLLFFQSMLTDVSVNWMPVISIDEKWIWLNL